MPVWNMRIFPVASIPFPKGIAIQSIKETTTLIPQHFDLTLFISS